MLRAAVIGVLSLTALPAIGQDATGDVQPIGSVQVAEQEVQLLVTYDDDAAFLVLAVSGDATGYVPLFASTYRGIPAVTVDISATTAGDAIWVQSSWPGNEVLAYYRLGEGRAMTGFGEMALLASPLPQSLSGGAVAFPDYDPEGVRKLASFYLE